MRKAGQKEKREKRKTGQKDRRTPGQQVSRTASQEDIKEQYSRIAGHEESKTARQQHGNKDSRTFVKQDS
jgi:hypothetical protein